jgi:hypothetical protein
LGEKWNEMLHERGIPAYFAENPELQKKRKGKEAEPEVAGQQLAPDKAEIRELIEAGVGSAAWPSPTEASIPIKG